MVEKKPGPPIGSVAGVPVTNSTPGDMASLPAVLQSFKRPTNAPPNKELGVPESWLTCSVCGCTHELDPIEAMRMASGYLQSTISNIDALDAVDQGEVATFSVARFIVGCPCCECDLYVPMDIALSISLAEYRASKAEEEQQRVLQELSAKGGNGNGGKKPLVN